MLSMMFDPDRAYDELADAIEMADSPTVEPVPERGAQPVSMGPIEILEECDLPELGD